MSRQELVASVSQSCYSSEPDPEVIMKTTIAIVFLLAGAGSALGQSGVSTQRDMYGNLVRGGGDFAPRGVNQGPQNMGPARSTPGQPAPASGSRPRSPGR